MRYIAGAWVPLVAWGRPYAYDPPGTGVARPRIFSNASFGAPGGKGDASDIDNLALASGGS
jgi:hypothetical protein